MKNTLVIAALATVLAGCSTMTPARYSVSMDNNQALKQYAGASVNIASITAQGDYNANCRLMGPIQASDNMTIPQFVEKAFNDELKFAGVYADKGIALDGVLTKISFSSTNGLTNGVWDLALKLNSSNGKSMAVESSYGFKSGFDAITACNQTAQALGPAVQDLVNKVAKDPRFAGLIK